MEPLVEVMQHKGDSECRNGIPAILGPDDEFCDFEKMENVQDPEGDQGPCYDGPLADWVPHLGPDCTSHRPVYESAFGAVVDPAVGTHCVSRYWGEMQEVYPPGPGRSPVRWDLGRDTDHAADSGQEWNGTADPVFTFPACQGDSELDCSIAANNKADPFLYGSAVVSNDRIDDESGGASGVLDAGSPRPVSGRTQQRQSLRRLDRRGRFRQRLPLERVPARGRPPQLRPRRLRHSQRGWDDCPGSHASFFRLPLSDIERTREYTPIPGRPGVLGDAHLQ